MLSHNLQTLRKKMGYSQQELASKVNVVRQTVSKWEQGLSVPDVDLLVRLSQVLETPVSVLLGENMEERKEADMKEIAERLELINAQLVQQKRRKQMVILICCSVLMVLVICGLIWFYMDHSSYMGWDYSDLETAVLGTGMHVIEWVFIRTVPFLLMVCSVIIFIIYRQRCR